VKVNDRGKGVLGTGAVVDQPLAVQLSKVKDFSRLLATPRLSYLARFEIRMIRRWCVLAHALSSDEVGDLCFTAAGGTGWTPGPVMPKDLGSPEQAARTIRQAKS
jgi:hypothetical protein